MGHWYRLLKYRVLIVLAMLVSVYLCLFVLIGSTIIRPSFEALDREHALTNLQRCVDSIHREAQHITAFASDWSVWDDTYQFVMDANENYVKANLDPEALESTSKANLLFILNNQGYPVAHVIYSAVHGGILRLPEFPETNWPHDHPLLQHSKEDSHAAGLIVTAADPILVASHPILTSHAEGPIHGTLIGGRFLNQQLLAGLKRDLHLDFSIHNVQRPDLPDDDRKMVAALENNPDGILQPVDEEHQRGFALLKDCFGRPALLLKANLDRNIVNRGKLAMKYAYLSNIGAAVLLLVGIYWLMQKLVLKRLAAMQRMVTKIDASGNRSLRLPMEGDDELTSLARCTNQMLTQVENSERILRENRRVAEEANQMKSRFLSNISHEIRTPINGIMGFSEAVVRAQSLETAQQHAQVILRESGVLLMLLNDLLDLARLESGKLRVERLSLDVHQLLDELRQTVVMQAQSKSNEFAIEIASDVPQFVWGDPLRLRQILLNLTTNAIKFTETGRVWITVERGTENNNDCLRFAVHDTGIGIPANRLNDIFDTFTQADVSTTRKYGGTGLGLAIVRQLVYLMGGQINVASEPGRGSVFSFWVPLDLAPPPASNVLEQTPRKERHTPPSQPAHILVADDYPANRDVIRLFLEEAGHHVTTVVDGQQALDLCMQQSFDVLILDVQMPVMDGMEAVHRIRQSNSPNANRPILALTANADAETRENCLRAGFTEVLTKPIRRQTFVASVERWYDPTHPATQPHAEKTANANLCDEKLPPMDIPTAITEFGGTEAFEKIVGVFLQSATQQLAQLQTALEQQERHSLRRIAHALRGAAATMEAGPLAQAAADLDTHADTAEMDQLRQTVNEIAAQLHCLMEYLKRSHQCPKDDSHAQSCD